MQDLARHKDPKTTRRYTKIADPARQAAVGAMRGGAGIAPAGTAAEPFRFVGKSPTAQSHRPDLRRAK
jgi:hypothetical protein